MVRRSPFLTWGKKVTLVQALSLCTDLTAHRGSRGITLLFLDHGTRKGWGVSVTPRPLFTPGKDRYPLYRKLVGPQGRYGQVRKISPPLGFQDRSEQVRKLSPPSGLVPRTVQPVASRYTYYDIQPTQYEVLFHHLSGGSAETTINLGQNSRFRGKDWTRNSRLRSRRLIPTTSTFVAPVFTDNKCDFSNQFQ